MNRTWRDYVALGLRLAAIPPVIIGFLFARLADRVEQVDRCPEHPPTWMIREAAEHYRRKEGG